MKFFRNLVKDNAGATAIEYGLIAALISIAAMTSLGGSLGNTFNAVSTNMTAS